MATKQPAIAPRAKITLRVWQPILDALNERSDAACIRRDGLITRALAKELPRIREELTVTNGPEARRYLEIKLKSLFAGVDGSSQISLALDPSVAQLLEEVCTEKNIPRECLLNRLLMLLGASTEFLHDHFFMIPDQPINPGNAIRCRNRRHRSRIRPARTDSRGRVRSSATLSRTPSEALRGMPGMRHWKRRSR